MNNNFDDLLDDDFVAESEAETETDEEEYDYEDKTGEYFKKSVESLREDDDSEGADVGSLKKKLMLLVIVGVIIVATVFVIYPKLQANKEKKIVQEKNHETNQMQEQQLPSVAGNKNDGNNNQATAVNVMDTTQAKVLSELKSIDKSVYKEIQGIQGITPLGTDKEQGVFTVADIKYYIKSVESDGQDILLRCVATGNISGVVGNFDVEVPAIYAESLKKGMQLKVEYKLFIFNNGSSEKRFINDIKFIS